VFWPVSDVCPFTLQDVPADLRSIKYLWSRDASWSYPHATSTIVENRTFLKGLSSVSTAATVGLEGAATGSFDSEAEALFMAAGFFPFTHSDV
jgi:hypothetical protein